MLVIFSSKKELKNAPTEEVFLLPVVFYFFIFKFKFLKYLIDRLSLKFTVTPIDLLA